MKAKVIPFGALVKYIVPTTRVDEQPGKWGGKGTPGVFGGYELGENGVWNGKYLVWNLADFAGVNLAKDVYAGALKVQIPSRMSTVTFDADDYTFPLRAEYIRKNETYEGVCDKAEHPRGRPAAARLGADDPRHVDAGGRGEEAAQLDVPAPAVAIVLGGGIVFVLTGIAPIRRLAENQLRIRTSAAAITALAIIIIGAVDKCPQYFQHVIY